MSPSRSYRASGESTTTLLPTQPHLRQALVLIAEQGKCAETDNPEAWWPRTRTDRLGLELARRTAAELCAGCPVLAKCRGYAIEAAEEHGTWGGLTEMDRDQLRRSVESYDAFGVA